MLCGTKKYPLLAEFWIDVAIYHWHELWGLFSRKEWPYKASADRQIDRWSEALLETKLQKLPRPRKLLDFCEQKTADRTSWFCWQRKRKKKRAEAPRIINSYEEQLLHNERRWSWRITWDRRSPPYTPDVWFHGMLLPVFLLVPSLCPSCPLAEWVIAQRSNRKRK